MSRIQKVGGKFIVNAGLMENLFPTFATPVSMEMKIQDMNISQA
jgi:hypothetical protein